MRVVVFGARGLAGLTWRVLTHDSPHEVVGFTVDAAHIKERQYHGLPVVPFEALEGQFPPAETAVVVPLGWQTVTGVRQQKRRAAKARGYTLISYVSSRSVTSADLVIGEDSLVFDGATIEPFVKLGDSVTVRIGCSLSHDATVGDNCYLAPRVCLAGSVTIGERCFLGVGAIVQSGVGVADGCFIAAGALVSRDTEEGGVYDGAPATRRSVPASRIGRLLGSA